MPSSGKGSKKGKGQHFPRASEGKSHPKILHPLGSFSIRDKGEKRFFEQPLKAPLKSERDCPCKDVLFGGGFSKSIKSSVLSPFSDRGS